MMRFIYRFEVKEKSPTGRESDLVLDRTHNFTCVSGVSRARGRRAAVQLAIFVAPILASFFVCTLARGQGFPPQATQNSVAVASSGKASSLRTRLRTPCADTEYIEAEIGSALINGDIEAFKGLIERNNVVWLDKGTAVSKILDNNLSKVRVQSGYYMGKACWLPSKGFFD